MLKMFQPTTSEQNDANDIKLKLSTQTTRPMMTTKSMIETAWVENMGQILYHLDSDARKITRRLEKLH